MTYRDMTFCAARSCKKFGPCFRSLTKEVEQRAERINAPISQFMHPETLECYESSIDIHPPRRKD